MPHAQLMQRLVRAVKARAGDGVPVDLHPSLVERTVAFYYGYYCDPWHLVGSLYATELMAHHRVSRMGEGLERLGVEATELEFIRIHASSDDEHARDWSEGVITPTLRVLPSVRRALAEGIAVCLDTSARYLDDLGARRSA